MADNIEIFICYAHQDESLMRELERQLTTLQPQELITIWHDRMIAGGADWKKEIDTHLNSANIILLLVSSNFTASKYSQVEVKRAMERHTAGEAQVIPVILKSVMWKNSIFGKLSPLPTDGKPITSRAWHNQDEAWIDVAEGIQKAVDELRRPVVPIAAQSNSSATQSSSHKEQQPMAQNEQFHVFLCYNSKDEAQVRGIALQLRDKGIKPWFDKWELRPGLPWQDALQKQIGQINAVAVFVGKDGVGPWQNMELNAYIRKFISLGCPVIPVLLGDASQKPTLPVFLEGMQYVDFRKPETDPMEQLLWGITGENPNDKSSKSVGAGGGPNASPVANPAPASTDASMATGNPGRLTFQQKSELVSKLLACQTMRDGNSRNMVVQELSFAGSISRNTVDRVDMMNIVNRSLDFSGGLQQLVDVVGAFEGDDLPMQQLRDFVDSLS